MQSGEVSLVVLSKGDTTNPNDSNLLASGTRKEVLKGKTAKFAFLQRRWLWGLCVGLIWFLVFSAGVLMDALPHREALGWKADDLRQDAVIGKLTQQIVKAFNPSTIPSEFPLPPDQAATALKLITTTIQAQSTVRTVANSSNSWTVLYHFAWGILLFTPINVALLSLLAGFIGGCASNESDRELIQEQIEKARTVNEQILLKRRLSYLQEHPAYSMMRSFIVYLVFISGLYVVSSDPFSPATQAQGFTQYIRLAGLVSLLGFVVGYDPTRFKQWLDLIPSPVQITPASANAGKTFTLTAEKTAKLTLSDKSRPKP